EERVGGRTQEAEADGLLLVAGEQKARAVLRPQRRRPEVLLEDRPAQARTPAVNRVGVARGPKLRVVFVLLEENLARALADVRAAHGLLARRKSAPRGSGEGIERLANHRSRLRSARKVSGG